MTSMRNEIPRLAAESSGAIRIYAAAEREKKIGNYKVVSRGRRR